MKNGKRETTEGIQLTNLDCIRTLEEKKEKLEVLGYIESGHLWTEKKEKNRKGYVRKRNVLEEKSHQNEYTHEQSSFEDSGQY